VWPRVCSMGSRGIVLIAAVDVNMGSSNGAFRRRRIP